MHELSQLRGFNVRQMLDLLAVVENGGVTAAADALNVSQPALTRSIRQLEDSLGVPLLEREGRGVVPTRFGESLAQHARTIEAELRHVTRDLSDLRRAEAGHLVIGATPIGLATLVPPVLARLHATRPDLSVEVRNESFETQLDALHRGEIDIVIGSLASGMSRHEHLVEEVLFQNSLAVLARSDNPLCDRDEVGLDELQSAAWVISRGSAAIRQIVANEFRFEGFDPPRFIVETDSMLCVKGVLMSGGFVTANPAELFAAEIERGDIGVIPIRWHSGVRPIGFTLREHGTVTPLLAELIDALREAGRLFANEVVAA